MTVVVDGELSISFSSSLSFFVGVQVVTIRLRRRGPRFDQTQISETKGYYATLPGRHLDRNGNIGVIVDSDLTPSVGGGGDTTSRLSVVPPLDRPHRVEYGSTRSLSGVSRVDSPSFSPFLSSGYPSVVLVSGASQPTPPPRPR